MIQQLHGLWCLKKDNFYSYWVNIPQCYKYVGALLFTMLVNRLASNPFIFMSQWKLLVCMCLVALNDYWLMNDNHMVLVCRKIYLKFIKPIRYNSCKNWEKIPNCTIIFCHHFKNIWIMIHVCWFSWWKIPNMYHIWKKHEKNHVQNLKVCQSMATWLLQGCTFGEAISLCNRVHK